MLHPLVWCRNTPREPKGGKRVSNANNQLKLHNHYYIKYSRKKYTLYRRCIPWGLFTRVYRYHDTMDTNICYNVVIFWKCNHFHSGFILSDEVLVIQRWAMHHINFAF